MRHVRQHKSREEYLIESIETLQGKLFKLITNKPECSHFERYGFSLDEGKARATACKLCGKVLQIKINKEG